MSIDDKRSYDEMLGIKIHILDMEYGKYYGIIKGDIIKPSIELNEYWTMQLYGNVVRKISDDELMMKIHPIQKTHNRGSSISELIKQKQPTIDTLL